MSRGDFMNHFFFDKDNCLVSITNSILHHFTGTSFHTPHKELSEILAKNSYDKVVIMLFDGLGKSVQDKYLKPTDFIRRKRAFDRAYHHTNEKELHCLEQGRRRG